MGRKPWVSSREMEPSPVGTAHRFLRTLPPFRKEAKGSATRQVVLHGRVDWIQ
jgi:hypothetical protein